MKKMHYLLGALALGAITLTSCSDDDNESNDVGIAGTYELEAVNTETATDFNDDGTEHSNQMEESGCYDAGRIKLNSDSTFTYTITGILIDTSDGSVGCKESFQASGTWEIQTGTSNNAVISAAYEDQNGDDQVITLVKAGNQLTYTEDNILSTYPDRNDDGEAFYNSGSTTYVFEK
ncbi:hypothetical protein ACLI09_11955 [Flavobacterium sp. RHBU_24]|uniref:hypothetical protein n=1 Tax=Flavobacterium sp. RHBU_24 TaxID=3391185 RepID=UPI003984F13E